MPDLDDPLQFRHVPAAETAKYPGSTTVDGAAPSPATAAEVRQRLEKAVSETAKPKKPVEYGKRKDKSPTEEKLLDSVDTAAHFHVELVGGKNYAMTLDKPQFDAFAADAEIQDWAAQRSLSDVCELFRKLLTLDGAARLQEFYENGKICMELRDGRMVVQLLGKTPAGDFEKFLRKEFSSKSTLKAKLTVFFPDVG